MFLSVVESIKEVLNSDVVIYGVGTLTIGGLLLSTLKVVIPNGKTNRQNAREIAKLKVEIENLKADQEVQNVKINQNQTLTNQIIENSPNKKINRLREKPEVKETSTKVVKVKKGK